MSLAVAAALLAALGYAAGSVLQSVGVRAGSGAAALARSPLYLTGLGCDGLAWLLSLVALRRLPTFTVQALLAGSLALTVLLARVFLRSRLRRVDAVAVAVMVVALAVVGAAGTEQPSPTLTSTAETTLLLATAALVVVALVLRRNGSAVQAAVAGVGYSVAALAARAVDVPTPWWHVALEPLAWAVVVGGAVGTLAYAAALERGSVGPATALLWAVEVVLPAVVGVLLLGDAVREGWWAAAVAGVVAVVASTVVLARSPAVPAA